MKVYAIMEISYGVSSLVKIFAFHPTNKDVLNEISDVNDYYWPGKEVKNNPDDKFKIFKDGDLEKSLINVWLEEHEVIEPKPFIRQPTGHPNCYTCGGAGWVWGYELPGGEDPETDTRYPCPYCDEAKEEEEYDKLIKEENEKPTKVYVPEKLLKDMKPGDSYKVKNDSGATLYTFGRAEGVNGEEK